MREVKQKRQKIAAEYIKNCVKNNNRRKTLHAVVVYIEQGRKNRERRLNEFSFLLFFRLLIAVVVASVHIQALPALVCNLTLLEFFYSFFSFAF